jgi:hypothetical protein
MDTEAALNTARDKKVGNKFNFVIFCWGSQVSTTKGTGGDLILLEETAQVFILFFKKAFK